MMSKFVFPSLLLPVAILGYVLYFTQILSHGFCFLFNPGVAVISNTTKRIGLQMCRTCDILLDIETEPVHCEDCDICVEGFDHHCPWTGKCIGRRNLYGFYVFVISTFGFFIYSMVCVIVFIIVMTSV